MKTRKSKISAHGQEALAALREAVRKLRREAARAGRPVVIWRNGRVVLDYPGRRRGRTIKK